MKAPLSINLAVALLALAFSAHAEDLKTAIQDEHAAGADHWIYNDLDAALAAARKTGKPIFATFRCVPCKACMAFDAEVARGNERVAKLASEKFIPLRIVEMKGVPLDLFQFDHDLNWAAMFINADKVVYGRYGTQSSEGPDAYNSIEGLLKTMRRVLDLHALYPAVAKSLEGKRPPETPYKFPLEMPGMRNADKLAAETARNNCVHCHMIHDAENFEAVGKGTWSIENLWRYPHPDAVGLKIDPIDGRKISAVSPGSPAGAAGLKAGMEVLKMNDQPIISIADMQWVLHHLENKMETIEITARDPGAGENAAFTLKTGPNWKSATDFGWRGSMWSSPPKLRTWMPPLSADEKKKRGLGEDEGALLVKWINRKEAGGRAVFDSGIRQGDVLVAFEGEPIGAETGEPRKFHASMKLKYRVGDTVTLTVLRGKERKEFEVKLVE